MTGRIRCVRSVKAPAWLAHHLLLQTAADCSGACMMRRLRNCLSGRPGGSVAYSGMAPRDCDVRQCRNAGSMEISRWGNKTPVRTRFRDGRHLQQDQMVEREIWRDMLTMTGNSLSMPDHGPGRTLTPLLRGGVAIAGAVA